MAKYRHRLPQCRDGLFLTDGGMETTLIFQEGIDLPHFASFVLLGSADGRARLERYYETYLTIAREQRTGFVLDTPTWRANADWGARLGYDAAALRAVNLAAVELLAPLRARWESPDMPCVFNGAIGPRGDGYKSSAIDADEAEAYHRPQIEAFAASEVDMVTAYTLTSVGEATGIARAAKAAAMPCVISFTVETDGRLASGGVLGDAIEAVDAATDASPAYYMINCAHPAHFEHALSADAPWMRRVQGVRANASTKSHAELDDSTTLDAGDPADLGRRYRALRQNYPTMRVLGGCCGTDHRHVAEIGRACVGFAAVAV
ncbi:homocysteine S-methyltransferase family protein [Rhodopseudomonas sp. NSM]|uniref:homocysteine S-methyltransferase family protein n=1 Tax=Rhodopseudomonas sp. NSM TaxID=3457630 RepID=UPI004036A3B0